MSAALPPVSDCCCCRSSSSSSSSSTSSSCCPLSGINDPNFDGIVPDDPTLLVQYWQYADLINGPVAQVWYWNPTLAVWQ